MSWLCSPSSGERRTSAGESESLIGMPTVANSPRSGCGTVTTISLSTSEVSSMISLVDRIGPHGMLCALSFASTSHLLCSIDQSSIIWNILSSLDSRTSGVFQSGSSASSGRPISLVIGSQPTGWTIT
jgi:hypothetical protein